MNPKTEQAYEELKNERDVLLTLTQSAQKAEKELKLTLELLILAGHVNTKHVQQARELAKQDKTV